MTVRETYDDDDYGVEIVWGADVTGNEGEPPETLVIVTTKGALTMDAAVRLGQWLKDTLEGNL